MYAYKQSKTTNPFYRSKHNAYGCVYTLRSKNVSKKLKTLVMRIKNDYTYKSVFIVHENKLIKY